MKYFVVNDEHDQSGSPVLEWNKQPRYVLIIKKRCDSIFESFVAIIRYLIDNHKLIIYVEEEEYNHDLFRSDERIKYSISSTSKPFIRKLSCPKLKESLNEKIDLIICIGGDGTLLHANSLFQSRMPPVLSIHMGSLGFLCPFSFENYPEYLDGVIKGGVPILQRNRLKCTYEKSSNTSESISMTSTEDEILSLNEIVISRGPSSFVTLLDLYVNDYLITTVQGDGLIISTPTGSTAYAMAAGASMSHPALPAIIITPICPHSLSFRPIVVPANVVLKVTLGADARHTAWFSVDGRANKELKHGHNITITTSEYPLLSICRSDQITDWFSGLVTNLHWNQRSKQLPLNSCYIRSDSELQSPPRSHSSFSSDNSTSTASSSHTQIHFVDNNNSINIP